MGKQRFSKTLIISLKHLYHFLTVTSKPSYHLNNFKSLLYFNNSRTYGTFIDSTEYFISKLCSTTTRLIQQTPKIILTNDRAKWDTSTRDCNLFRVRANSRGSTMIPEYSSLNEDLIEQIARWHLAGYHCFANSNAVGPLKRNRYAVYQQHFLLSHAGLLFAVYHLHPRPKDRLHRRLDLVIVHSWESIAGVGTRNTSTIYWNLVRNRCERGYSFLLMDFRFFSMFESYRF